LEENGREFRAHTGIVSRRRRSRSRLPSLCLSQCGRVAEAGPNEKRADRGSH
jgi:hypothetical protein